MHSFFVFPVASPIFSQRLGSVEGIAFKAFSKFICSSTDQSSNGIPDMPPFVAGVDVAVAATAVSTGAPTGLILVSFCPCVFEASTGARTCAA